MTLFFIISVGFLLGVLAASLLAKKINTLWKIMLAVAGCFTLVGLCALLFNHFTAGKIGFLNPWVFGLMIFPFGAFIGHALLRGYFTRTVPFSLTHLNIEQDSLRILLTRWLPITLYTGALFLMVIALARPVKIDRTTLPPTEGIDIILLMDTSGSMQKEDFYPNRFVASQQTAKRFVSKRLTDRIGIVVFAAKALLQAPLTLDHDALQEYLSAMYLGIVDPQATAIGDALGVAANHLKDSKAKSKVIILLTDGDSNAGTIEPLLAAKAAAALGIRVYTVGVARSPDQKPYSNQEDEINEGLLLEIAQRTGGKFYRANNEDELDKIYNTIDELEKTEFAPSSTISRTDAYQLFLWFALGIVLLGLVFEKIFLIRVP